jgi:hypothetical protein
MVGRVRFAEEGGRDIAQYRKAALQWWRQKKFLDPKGLSYQP